MAETELAKTGEQIVKKKRKSPPRPEQQVQTKPGENRALMLKVMRLWDLPKIDMSDEVQVAQRCQEYFDICAEEDMKPSLEGLAFSLGVSREYLWQIRAGVKGKNERVVHTLKKANDILNIMLVEYMENGKINPIPALFLLKNNFGYSDKQEFILTPQSPLGEGTDARALEDRYKTTVVVEDQTAEG